MFSKTSAKLAHITEDSMPPTGKTPLPPYTNLDPEAAARKLSDPIDTAR